MYLTMAFSLSVERPEVWDIDPMKEDGEVWRSIHAAMPQRLATHRRTLDIVDVDRLKLPSKRRAFVCNKRYELLRDRCMVRLDFSNLRVNRASVETAGAA